MMQRRCSANRFHLSPLFSAAAVGVLFMLVASSAQAVTNISQVVKCQKRFAKAGATFAKKVINFTLKCSTEVLECEIQCEEGVFGPLCTSNPPPDPPGCCDPEDPSSNATYQACLDDAELYCDKIELKINDAEARKRTKIFDACTPLTTEEFCGAETPGLNFATLNAGCLALDPSYTCSVANLIDCVGGPLQRSFIDQISGLIGPRSGTSLALVGLQTSFPDVPIVRKATGFLPAPGIADVYSITGQAGDEIDIILQTRDDNGNGTSNMIPEMIVFDIDGTTPLDDTNVANSACAVPNVCGGPCPQVRRTLPFDGTFFVAVQAGLTCGPGTYRLLVKSVTGVAPLLIADDVPGGSALGGFVDNTSGDGLL